MDRIATATAEPDLFGAGKDGFRDGNKALGIAATDFNAAWCNAIQEEIMAVIESAGLVPDNEDYTQLLDAIMVIVAGGLTGYARLAVAQSFTKAQRGTPVALPATTGSIALDLDLGNNFEGTLTGNSTLANPSNIVPGQSGVIRITNGATPYTLAYGSYFKAPGGILPVLTAIAGAVDVIGYYVVSATHILLIPQGDSR